MVVSFQKPYVRSSQQPSFRNSAVQMKYCMKKYHSSRGVALGLVIFVLLILFITGGMILYRMQSETAQSIKLEELMRASYAAEAGIADGLYQLLTKEIESNHKFNEKTGSTGGKSPYSYDVLVLRYRERGIRYADIFSLGHDGSSHIMKVQAHVQKIGEAPASTLIKGYTFQIRPAEIGLESFKGYTFSTNLEQLKQVAISKRKKIEERYLEEFKPDAPFDRKKLLSTLQSALESLPIIKK